MLKISQISSIWRHFMLNSIRTATNVQQNRFESTNAICQVEGRTSNPACKGFTKDGGQIYEGFVYYPRHPGQQDPPYTPSKMFMVQRIRCLKKKPYWEKNIMKQLTLDGKRSEIAIIPNTPKMNAMLWKVKHLIRITPITFPNGIPKDSDWNCTRLLENGQLVFVPQLKEDLKTAELEAQQEPKTNLMDGETLRKHLRLKWIKPWN